MDDASGRHFGGHHGDSIASVAGERHRKKEMWLGGAQKELHVARTESSETKETSLITGRDTT